jgi:putative copper export protein
VLYARAVLLRALPAVPPDARPALAAAAGRRFHPILWTAIAVLLVTGLYNVGVVAGADRDPGEVYWQVLGVKVALALLLFGLALAVTLPLPALAAFQRRRRPQVLVANLVLAAVVLYLSAYLRRL